MVSAIITTHNRCDVLPRAIQSVLNQTYKDIELIVVSDGSTDGTDELMKQYEGDERIRYISYHPGRGGNYARNTGIKAAEGEYVAFLDDDDEWLPEKVEKQLDVFSTDKEIGLVYTGCYSIYVNQDITYIHTDTLHGDLSKRILFDNRIGSTSTVMVRKSILERSGLFDEKLRAIQDYDLWIRICQVCKVGVVSKPLINYYNVIGTNQISDKTKVYEECNEYVLSKYSDLYKTLTESELKYKKSYDFTELALRAIRNNNGKVARNYVRKALFIHLSFRAITTYICSFLSYTTILRIRKITR